MSALGVLVPTFGNQTPGSDRENMRSIAFELSMSLPGSTGQFSTRGRRLPDRPVKPGDDGEACVKLNDKAPG